MNITRGLRLFPRTIGGTLFLLLSIALIPLLSVQAWHYYSMFQMQQMQAQEANLEVARAVAATFEAYVNDIRHQELAAGLALTSPQPLPVESENQFLTTLADESPAVNSYNWTDHSGLILASSLPEAPGVSVGDRPYFQEILQGQEWVVGDLVIGRVLGLTVFTIARGMRDATGTLQGVVVVAVNAERLGEVLTIERSGNASIAVIDRNGRLVYRYPEVELAYEQRRLFEDDSALARSLAGEEVTVTYLGNIDQSTRVAGLVPIRPMGWVAVASRPEAEVLVPLIQDLLGNIGVVLLVAIVATLVAVGISRRITGPVRRLEGHAVALGGGDFGRRVVVGGPVELERLGEAFNAMADEVQRALRLREEFLTVAAHELRTPLTVIRGYSQLLVRGETDEEKRRALQTVVRQADRMTDLLNDMLRTAEIRAGHLELRKESLDLSALAKDVVVRMQSMTEKHRLRLGGDERVMVDADRGQVEVVLTNLIDNAIRYSPLGGDVEITISDRVAEAVVAVKDHGIGIPNEKQRHVFEPFFQIQPAIAGFGGLGLGLFISKQIVERHGGRMWFESEEGRGSTFYFTLPVARPWAEQPRPEGGFPSGS